MPLPKDFFNFDLRDTLRVVIWIIIVAFGAGGFYVQRKADLDRLDTANIQITALIQAQKKTIAATNTRMEGMTNTITRRSQTDAVIAASLEGIRTELRYVNEKIDVLRQDVRNKTPSASRP